MILERSHIGCKSAVTTPTAVEPRKARKGANPAAFVMVTARLLGSMKASIAEFLAMRKVGPKICDLRPRA